LIPPSVLHGLAKDLLGVVVVVLDEVQNPVWRRDIPSGRLVHLLLFDEGSAFKFDFKDNVPHNGSVVTQLEVMFIDVHPLGALVEGMLMRPTLVEAVDYVVGDVGGDLAALDHEVEEHPGVAMEVLQGSVVLLDADFLVG